MKNHIWVLLFCFLSTAVYINTFSNGFTWDDEYLITENPSIKDIKNIPLFFTNQKTQTISNMKWYRPLRSVFYALEYHFFQDNATGYHVVNLLIHLCNILLIYWFVFFIADVERAAITALIFSVHPILTESVSSITGMADLLCATFLLLSLCMYLKIHSSQPHKKLFNVLFFLSFCAALLSKEMAVVLPVILILLHILNFKTQRLSASAAYSYIAISGIIIIGYLFTWFSIVGNATGNYVYHRNGFINYMYMMTTVFRTYVRLLLFPVNQSARYDVSFYTSLFEFDVIASITLILLLLYLIILSYKHSKLSCFGMLWFFVCLLPVSNIIPLAGSMMGERFLYLPSIGFFIACSDQIARLKYATSKRTFKGLSQTFILIIVFIFAILSVNRNRVWTNNFTLFKDAVKKAPDSLAVRLNLVKVYERSGRTDLARIEYQDVIRINLLNTRRHIAWGKKHYNEGKFDEAIAEYKRAVNTNPTYPDTHSELAKVYEKVGDAASALREWEEFQRLSK